MLSRSIVKQGGTSTSTSSHFGTTHHPRHQVGAERAVAAARRGPLPTDGPLEQSNAARPRQSSSTLLEPLCLSSCRAVSIVIQQQLVRARHARCSGIVSQ